MDDNKREYDEFFRSSRDREENREDAAGDRANHEDQQPAQPAKPSYYYSYGPYKSQEDTSITSASDNGVEMTTPRPVRPLEASEERRTQQPMATWSANPPRRRSTFKSMFSAFLAGAVVVGGLMFYSDKSDLFGGHQGVMSSSSAAAATQAPSNSGIRGAALDIARPNSIAQIVQQASPAVVKIETLVKPQATSGRGRSLLDDPIFRQFFGGNGSGSGGGSTQQTQPNSGTLQPAGMGSGFIFEKSGYILTNQHVIEGADEIQVTVEGYDKPFTAKLLGNSFDLDLAVLKIDNSKDFPTLPLAASTDSVNSGDWVVAIGNPYGFDHTVTVGVLSAKERPISIPEDNGTRNYKHLLQTDASINPGNSGGPLLNMNGEVIGINTAVSAQAQGIGFAIPINTVQDVLDKLKNNVTIPKEPAPFVGVSLQDITPSIQSQMGLSSTDGAMVMDVQMGSPAFKAGLKVYDVVTGVNGTAIKTSTELTTKIKALKVGDKATLSIVRDGKAQNIAVTIGDRNTDPSMQQQQQQQ